jgi:hypothetical protein
MRAMAGINRLPPPPTILEMTSTIGGRAGRTAGYDVGRTVRGGFGGTTPILAHGAGVPADLYGLHQEELLRQPVVTLGGGLIPRADYGVRTPVDLFGLRADLIKRLAAKPPRGGE